MRALVWTANILGWPVIHLLFARVAISLPAERFKCDGLMYRAFQWETRGRIYRKRLQIQKWKGRLPDGAPQMGGAAKKNLASRDPQQLERSIVETRRAEWAHWCMLLCFPVFLLWNPPWACGVMVVYALAANMPCILTQRYNRVVLSRLLRKVAHDPL